MSQKIVGLEDVQPYKFSDCSKSDYIDALRMGHGLCLLNKPNEVGFVLTIQLFNLAAKERPQIYCNIKHEPLEV